MSEVRAHYPIAKSFSLDGEDSKSEEDESEVHTYYSVMQSDGNSFCGDVVLDTFNMVYSNEDSIFDKKYEKRIFGELYYEHFKF